MRDNAAADSNKPQYHAPLARWQRIFAHPTIEFA
jgi:hypothetical protein